MSGVTEIGNPGAQDVTRPKGIDLFAGAGGLSLGAIGAGIDVVGALELSKHACSTYRNNILRPNGEKVSLIEGDALTIEPSEALKLWCVEAGECDIVMGGPPCQGFSTHRLKDSGKADPRNKLLARYFDFVEAISPRVFFVENVPGLLWDRHFEYLEAFLSRAESAGFEVVGPVVLNARDYGVPQNRRRVFILGISRSQPLDVVWPPPATHVKLGTSENYRLGRPDWLLAGEVFGKAPAGDKNDVHMKSTQALIDVFVSTPLNGGSRSQSSRKLPCHDSHDGHKDVYGRIDPKKLGPTMTTACVNPSKGRFVHPVEHHGITLRQAARFQSFPDTFTFEGGLISGGEQIGNAVPVLLAQELLRPIVLALASSPSDA